MALRLLFPLIGIALLVVLVIAVTRLATSRGLRADAAGADLAAVEQWTTLWRWLGILAGFTLAIGALSAQDAGLGRLAMSAPAIGGCAVLLAIMLGELTIRPATTQRRTASLTTRTIADLLPRVRTWVASVGIALLGALLTVGVLTASPDDMGRAGRAITASCYVDLPGGESTLQTNTNGPYPGSFYAIPAALDMAITVCCAVVAARAIRDRANPDAGHTAYDTGLRRDAMSRVVSAVGATAYGTAAPISFVMAVALSSNDCIRGGDTFTGMLVVAGLGSVVVAAVLLANVLLPRKADKASSGTPASTQAAR